MEESIKMAVRKFISELVYILNGGYGGSVDNAAAS